MFLGGSNAKTQGTRGVVKQIANDREVFRGVKT